ncbi:MAG: PHP domain-containing protein, partial [Deltaproteobacteria bacterium]|nr:PHP domain-containing protein [Deltaproteobacteria bacterium]
NKHVGRKSCPHFANLIIECCDAAIDAVKIIKFEDAKAAQPRLTFENYIAGNIPAPKGKNPVERAVVREVDPVLNTAAQEKIKSVSSGFYVDLHIHTFPASQCSSATADEMIQKAKRIGLDAVCITDHNYIWDNTGIEALREKYDILVLRGNEITTDQGDMLVFGMYKDIQGIIKLEDLKKEVLNAEGFMIVAHPFRGFLVFGAGQLGLTAEKARTRSLFKFADAIEVLNGKVTENENKLAAEVAAGLKLPATGGSDAHEVYEVGKYATRFASKISNEKELLAALQSGDYDAVAFRKEKVK